MHRTQLIDDPRPTSDIVYLTSCRSKIKAFLLRKGYDTGFLPESIGTSPTLNEMTNTMLAIFVSLDPKLKLGNKLWEEVSYLMKMLQHPFRCSFPFSNTGQLWENLLSMFAWLIDTLSYRDKNKVKVNMLHIYVRMIWKISVLYGPPHGREICEWTSGNVSSIKLFFFSKLIANVEYNRIFSTDQSLIEKYSFKNHATRRLQK